MSTLLDEPRAPTVSSSAQRLRTTMAAVRLAFTWFGTRKTLSVEQKNQAAESFGAAGNFLSAGKKLIDTRHPAFQAVTAMRNRAVQYWKSMSLPYPEAGIRLIRQDDVSAFNVHMTTLRSELEESVDALNDQFSALKSAARERLGTLYSSSDYPHSLRGLFEMTWDFPSVEPPPYLQQLSPELYRQECERVSARFDEAIRLAEDAFIEELGKLVAHLAERLSGTDDGKPKVFRDSAVENLTEFFDRFRHLNVRSCAELDDLVVQAQNTVRGIKPQNLRDDASLRQQVAAQLASVETTLDNLLVERPRRNILRRSRE